MSKTAPFTHQLLISTLSVSKITPFTHQLLISTLKNHLACIKSRDRNCNASIEIGAHIAKFSQLGNLAYRTGKKINWDGKTTGDAEADSYLCKQYRAPWELPRI